MQTETIIRASAQIMRITELHAGDVYKRLETSGMESNLVFGIVTDVMSNGEDAAVVATEISKSYYGPTVRELKIFTTLSNVAIFPATPEEIAQRFAEYREEMGKKVAEAQKALDKAREEYQLVDATLRRVETANVTLATPAHDTFPPGWTPAVTPNEGGQTPADATAIGV